MSCGEFVRWFRPNRSDAEFCSSQCRQAAYRTRKKSASIKAAGEKTEDPQPYADLYGDHRGFAVYLRNIARRYDVKVRFMAALNGILAVEETPEALAARDWARIEALTKEAASASGARPSRGP